MMNLLGSVFAILVGLFLMPHFLRLFDKTAIVSDRKVSLDIVRFLGLAIVFGSLGVFSAVFLILSHFVEGVTARAAQVALPTFGCLAGLWIAKQFPDLLR